jgi:hypothetical protein
MRLCTFQTNRLRFFNVRIEMSHVACTRGIIKLVATSRRRFVFAFHMGTGSFFLLVVTLNGCSKSAEFLKLCRGDGSIDAPMRPPFFAIAMHATEFTRYRRMPTLLTLPIRPCARHAEGEICDLRAKGSPWRLPSLAPNPPPDLAAISASAKPHGVNAVGARELKWFRWLFRCSLL